MALKNRHGRFRDSEAFRQLFESVRARCIAGGLARGEGFATDASIIKADAQRQCGLPGNEPIPGLQRLDLHFKLTMAASNLARMARILFAVPQGALQ